VISKSNTKAEIARKMNEYFVAGARLAWVVDPKTETVRVHQAPRKFVVLRAGDVLDGGDVLPGFQVPVRDLFELEDD
jgi:Uma2 family endonuclease